jgi:hypothetical protein
VTQFPHPPQPPKNPKLLIEQQKFDYDHKFDLFSIIILNLLRLARTQEVHFFMPKKHRAAVASCAASFATLLPKKKKAAEKPSNKKNFLHISTD